jgi:hypothetical protein
MSDQPETLQPELSPEDTRALPTGSSTDELRQQRRIMVGIVIGVGFVLVLLLGGLLFLLNPNTDPETVARVRDVFIIIMALESLLVGLVLTVLAIQLARLTNLLQNEIGPILDSTNETINNLRGTTAFLSDNLAEPIIKLNEYIAGLQRLTELFGFNRKR